MALHDDEEDEEEGDGLDVTLSEDLPPVTLAWSVVCYDHDGSKLPLRLHRAAVGCLIRTLDAHHPGPRGEGADNAE